VPLKQIKPHTMRSYIKLSK